MSSNAFDMVRKIRHLPGLQVTATIDPTKISKRVKSVAQKMLRNGVLHGGYRSQSRLLAEQVLAEQVLDDSTHKAWATWTSWGVGFAPCVLTASAREQITELICAARMVELANVDSSSAKFTHERYDHILAALNERHRIHMSIYQPTIHKQIAELVSACRSPELVNEHNALADRLDSIKPFRINF